MFLSITFKLNINSSLWFINQPLATPPSHIHPPSFLVCSVEPIYGTFQTGITFLTERSAKLQVELIAAYARLFRQRKLPSKMAILISWENILKRSSRANLCFVSAITGARLPSRSMLYIFTVTDWLERDRCGLCDCVKRG